MGILSTKVKWFFCYVEVKIPYYYMLLAIIIYHNIAHKLQLNETKCFFKTLPTFYCIVYTESKLTYRNNQVGYTL